MLPESPQADVQVLMLLEQSVLRGLVQHLRSRTPIPLGEDLGKQPLKVAEVLAMMPASVSQKSATGELGCSLRAAAEKSDGSVSSDNTSIKAAKSGSYAGTGAREQVAYERSAAL